jgi:hypothetical protein
MKVTEMTREMRKCIGETKINQLSIEALKNLIPQLMPYLGKKVALANGAFSKKFEVELLKIPFDADLGMNYRSYLSVTRDNIVLNHDITIKDTEYPDGGYSVSYYKKSLSVAKISGDGELTEVVNIDGVVKSYQLETVYDYSEQVKLKEKINILEDEIRTLKRSCII